MTVVVAPSNQWIIDSPDQSAGTAGTAFEKVKEITIMYPGTYRIKYAIFQSGGLGTTLGLNPYRQSGCCASRDIKGLRRG